jgi:hypothetical protein
LSLELIKILKKLIEFEILDFDKIKKSGKLKEFFELMINILEIESSQ